MKKSILFLGLFLIGMPAWAIDTASEINSINTMTTPSNKPADNSYESDAPPSAVNKTADGADYSAGAGDGAANMDMAIDIGSMIADRLVRLLMQALPSWAQSIFMSSGPVTPIWAEHNWLGIWFSWNLVDTATQLGHAAVNKFMRDATYITASFTGAEGYVTDKWVGPPNYNQTVAIMGDVDVSSQAFGAIAFDPNEYKGLKNAANANARELMDYRTEQLVEDQRSLENVAEENWGIHYRAQQRSIKALAGALSMKAELAKLAEADVRINAEYGTKPKALNTVASRRALYDALMLLKMNVMAARVKMRSETLELDFKPLTREPETVPSTPAQSTTPSLPHNTGA